MTRIIALAAFLLFIFSCSSPQIEDRKLKTSTSQQKKTEIVVLNNDSFELDIEKRFNNCIEENGCTVCIEECTIRAIKDWRAEMNKYYTLLLDNLDKPSKDKLILSQTNWLEFSELELQFNTEFYSNMDGTIWNGVSLQQSKEKIKSRALTLKAHYDALTGDAVKNNLKH